MKNFDDNEIFNLKQHLGLSTYAQSIIDEDIIIFDIKKKDPFINLVLQNYLELDKYPVNMRMQFESIRDTFSNYLSEEHKALSDPYIKAKAVECIDNALVDTFSSVLSANTPIYMMEKGKNSSFNLSEANAEEFGEWGGTIMEDLFKTPGKFIHSVLENYARLPFIEREEIILYNKIQELRTYIKKGKAIQLHHSNGNVYTFIPYVLSPDKRGSYWYVAGISINEETETSRIPVSIRVSRIKSMRSFSSFRKISDDKLSLSEKKMLSDLIKRKGIQYLINDLIEAKVRLTPNGQKQFNRQLFMRPEPFRVDGDIYLFEATKTQLWNYFLSFGRDAEVLEPESLRSQFAQYYYTASKVYE